MRRLLVIAMALVFVGVRCLGAEPAPDEKGWVRLFDGSSLDGWKVGENAGSFKVQDGAIVVNGPVAHLFYAGDVKNHDFKNFEFKTDVMTFPKANSGIYIHTKYQERGFPKIGYEVQVNNSHTDPKRTGGLYGVEDVYRAPAKDNAWFNVHILVRGKHIEVRVDGKKVVDFTEPAGVTGPRRLSSGTFAFQAHDPVSKVCYKNVMVRPLPD